MTRNAAAPGLVGTLLLGLLLSGCSSSDEVPRASAAMLDLSSPDRDPIAVTIDRIDDGSVRAWGLSSGSKRCTLPPGAHSVSLAVADFWERDPQLMAGKTSLKAEQVVTFTFEADHTYRFTASRTGNTFDVTLWDETTGKKTAAQHWSVDALNDYQPFTS